MYNDVIYVYVYILHMYIYILKNHVILKHYQLILFVNFGIFLPFLLLFSKSFSYRQISL